mgnify:CR=1 FL=1
MYKIWTQIYYIDSGAAWNELHAESLVIAAKKVTKAGENYQISARSWNIYASKLLVLAPI